MGLAERKEYDFLWDEREVMGVLKNIAYYEFIYV